MKLSPFRLLAVVVILLAAGLGIAGYLLIGEDEDESGGDGDDVALDTTTSSRATTTTTDGGFTNLNTSTTAAGASTTTTRAATTTTTSRSTTTTTGAATTTTVAGGTTTTTTRAGTGTGICGSGLARVLFTAENLITTGTDSSFTAQAVVTNEITKPIEVETLAFEVRYPDGSTKTVRFSTAGTTIAPGASSTFTGERVSNPTQFSSAKVSSFAYFTSGQRDRCRVST